MRHGKDEVFMREYNIGDFSELRLLTELPRQVARFPDRLPFCLLRWVERKRREKAERKHKEKAGK